MSEILYVKKREYKELGIKLKTNRRAKRMLITSLGEVHYTRDVLCPASKEDMAKLMEIENRKSIAPLDEHLGISDLPFKLTRQAMLEVAFWGQNQCSFNTRTKDENGSTWRENKLGEIFSSDNIYYWTDKKGIRQHKIQKKEYISYVGSVNEFKKHLFACALRGGYGSYKKTVLISDGATWIRNMTQELFPDAQRILDYFHLCENVNAYAKHLFRQDESLYKPWVKDICDALKCSEFSVVLAELEKSKDKTLKNCSINLYGYITNNINNIDYKSYESCGYFIGSGAIESGNKLILQQRLKQSGMRWNVETAQPLLTLRAKSESSLWDSDVVKFILDSEM